MGEGGEAVGLGCITGDGGGCGLEGSGCATEVGGEHGGTSFLAGNVSSYEEI